MVDLVWAPAVDDFFKHLSESSDSNDQRDVAYFHEAKQSLESRYRELYMLIHRYRGDGPDADGFVWVGEGQWSADDKFGVKLKDLIIDQTKIANKINNPHLKVLLQRADVFHNRRGFPLLHEAIMGKHWGIVDKMIDLGCFDLHQPLEPTFAGWKPEAAFEENQEIFQYVSFLGDHALTLLIRCDDGSSESRACFVKMLDRDPDFMNKPNMAGWLALGLICFFGRFHLLQEVLQGAFRYNIEQGRQRDAEPFQSADPRTREMLSCQDFSIENNTPLMIAAIGQHSMEVIALINAGALLPARAVVKSGSMRNEIKALIYFARAIKPVIERDKPADSREFMDDLIYALECDQGSVLELLGWMFTHGDDVGKLFPGVDRDQLAPALLKQIQLCRDDSSKGELCCDLIKRMKLIVELREACLDDDHPGSVAKSPRS